MEQTRTRPPKTLGFVMNKQLGIFSFSPPINLLEEGKWLLGVTAFEATNPVFNISNENNCFSFTIPDHWETESAEETIDELNNFLELRSQNDNELHNEQVRKKFNRRLFFTQSWYF